MTTQTILWRRLDLPGQEAARLEPTSDGWLLSGKSAFAFDGRPCSLAYRIDCAADWRTRSCEVRGWIGREKVEVAIEVEDGRWRLNGVDQPQVDGCIDVDLNFSPSTNLLPIRRLALAVGAEAEVRAAWLRFPSFALEPLEQRYRRTAESIYRYQSAGDTFVRDLTVNDAGFVTRYPDFFETDAET